LEREVFLSTASKKGKPSSSPLLKLESSSWKKSTKLDCLEIVAHYGPRRPVKRGDVDLYLFARKRYNYLLMNLVAYEQVGTFG